MQNYYFRGFLVEKISNPNPNFHLSSSYAASVTEAYGYMPALWVVVPTADMSRFETILNELTTDYIIDEKLCVFLIDGSKCAFVDGLHCKKMPEALITYWSPGTNLSETFSSFTRDAVMTKELLLNWLTKQMVYVQKRTCAYDEGYRQPVLYTVLSDRKGQYKIWPKHRPLPKNWSEEDFTGYKEDCLAFIEQITS